MNKLAGVFCLTLYPALAGATNFEACVNDAKANNKVTTADGYAAYKCEAATAEKLAARPDECAGGAKPFLSNLVRKYNQLEDGLSTSLSWRAGKCVGSCVTRSYDSKDTTYSCEVRIYADDGKPADTGGATASDAGGRPASTEFRHTPSYHWPYPLPRHAGRPAAEPKGTRHASPRTYTGRSDRYSRPNYYSRPDYYPKPDVARRPSYYGTPPYSGREYLSRDYSEGSGYSAGDYPGGVYPRRDYSDRAYSSREYSGRSDYYPGRGYYGRPDAYRRRSPETPPDCDCR